MINLPPGPLMVDVEGTILTEEERKFLSSPAVGAVILFSRNFESREQVTDLVREIKSIRQPELLVAVDQEGGRVQRFRDGFTALPPLRNLGTLHDTDPQVALESAHSAGLVMASEIRLCGIDFSFAPVLDCANPESKVIGDRGFHHDPDIIATLAESYISGMNQAGMKATGKHFPGHGWVTEDSHHELPMDPRSFDEIFNHDLIPYAKLVNHLGGVMTGHVLYKAVDSEIPANSTFWIRDILRGSLGFKGMIFSDDLTMKGAQTDDTISTRVDNVLSSGCNMALICNDPENARRAAMKSDSGQSNQRGFIDSMKATPCFDVSQATIELAMERVSTLASTSPGFT